jgi:hypothetical protein
MLLAVIFYHIGTNLLLRHKPVPDLEGVGHIAQCDAVLLCVHDPLDKIEPCVDDLILEPSRSAVLGDGVESGIVQGRVLHLKTHVCVGEGGMGVDVFGDIFAVWWHGVASIREDYWLVPSVVLGCPTTRMVRRDYVNREVSVFFAIGVGFLVFRIGFRGCTIGAEVTVQSECHISHAEVHHIVLQGFDIIEAPNLLRFLDVPSHLLR